MGQLVDHGGGKPLFMLDATLRIEERSWQRSLGVKQDGALLELWGPSERGYRILATVHVDDLSWLCQQDLSVDVGNGQLRVGATELEFLAGALLPTAFVPRPRARLSQLAERVL